MANIPHFTARLLTIALSFLGLLSCGCLTEIYEQAQNAAQRKQTFNELKQLGIAFHNFHDSNNRGPKNWQEFQQVVPAGLQQTLEAQGYQFVWDVSISDMRVGTSNFVIAYPRDAETAGGLVLMGDASVHQLTADEFQQKFADQNPDRAQQQASAPTPPPAPAESGVHPPAAATQSNAVEFSSTPAQPTVVGTYQRGDKVFTQYAGSWEPVEILEALPGDQYKIRWTKWGPQWDEVVPASRLVAKAPAAANPSTAFSPPEPFGPPAPFGGRPTPGFGAENDPGAPIDNATPLAPGDKVLAKWAGKWIPADVVALRGPSLVTVRLESDGFGNKMPVDPTLPRGMLRLPAGASSETANSPSAASAPPAASSPATPSPASAAEFRTWTDSSGKFQIDAKFVSVADGAVTLEKRGGVQIRMPLEKLSAADREFVTKQALQP